MGLDERNGVSGRTTDSMICGENVGVVAPEVRSRSSQSVDGEIEFESVGSSLLLLFAVSSHTLTRAISDGFLPGKSAAAAPPPAAVLKRSARSLVSFGCCANLNKGLSVPLRPRPPPPPPLCSLIKLSPFKSVTVRASVSNLRAAAADCREGRRT